MRYELQQSLPGLERVVQAAFEASGIRGTPKVFCVSVACNATASEWLVVSPPDEDLQNYLMGALPPLFYSYIPYKNEDITPTTAVMRDAMRCLGDDESDCFNSAVQELLNKRLEGRTVWCSLLSGSRDDNIAICLSIDTSAARLSPALNFNLKRELFYTGMWHEGYFLSSLVGALAAVILTEFSATSHLTIYHPDRHSHLRTPTELIQQAARVLLEQAVRHVMPRNDYQTHEVLSPDLFDACNAIADLRYESTSVKGAILVTPWPAHDSSVSVAFHRPVPLRQARRARKLLEMTRAVGALVTNGDDLLGLATGYDAAIFSIVFLGEGVWELQHRGKSVMRVRKGSPSLALQTFDEAQFLSILRAQFRGYADDEFLTSVMLKAVEAYHGTTVVISSDAKSEAKRLETQSLRLTPRRPGLEMALGMMAIDGALLLDHKGTCYAAGVILDGEASPRGDPSRGARFNSAIRYLERNREKSCVIAVFSEDGSVDLLTSNSFNSDA